LLQGSSLHFSFHATDGEYGNHLISFMMLGLNEMIQMILEFGGQVFLLPLGIETGFGRY